MIVEMKKVTLATPDKASRETLESVRELGVIHVQPVSSPESEDTRDLQDKLDRVHRALEALEADEREEEFLSLDSALDRANSILALVEQIRECRKELEAVSAEIKRIEPLGDFDPSDFQFLKEKGLRAQIYRCGKKEWQEARIRVPFGLVGHDEEAGYILAVNEEDFELPLKRIELPEQGLRDLQEREGFLREKFSKLGDQLNDYNGAAPALLGAHSLLKERLEFEEVLAGMGKEDRIVYLQGYCPAEETGKLKEKAEKLNWGLLVEDPKDEQEVPTLIRNPRWIRIIEPVYKFMGTVPGYAEYDISFWFLVSLSIFFAMLVSDGGYGLLFLGGAYIARRRFREASSEVLTLSYFFGAATVVWGLISGTWFGVEQLSRLPLLNRAVIPALNSFSMNQDFMIKLCFILGVIHLSVAHGKKGLRHLPSLHALKEAGWIMILWFLYFMAGHLVLEDPVPGLAPYLLVAGLLSAGLFSGEPGKGFLNSALQGFANLPLSIIRSFSDLVSYLRLYAVGYATVVVAVNFNTMAASLADEGVFLKFTGAPVVLFLGHAMNILMAVLAVLVHGIRLNVLEFSSHLEMGWSGKEYRPFRSRIQN